MVMSVPEAALEADSAAYPPPPVSVPSARTMVAPLPWLSTRIASRAPVTSPRAVTVTSPAAEAAA
jgi:hypothetical protein